ncbi:hypothetical protein C1645_841558 [Glomus cerebriforme]|uniref:Uncharacterized protein n=1 Tax=Glomus cerebriforme TaxID=658196 RepID=A0A397S526_9GLOM|nr:hypothetical protein C1645_841558 [Glomus cerebriforme]
MFCNELDDTITGSELFPGELLTPINYKVDLPDNLYEQLINYYNEAYNDLGVEFISMNYLIEKGLQNDSSNRYIIVQLIINQCRRIHVAAEIFRLSDNEYEENELSEDSSEEGENLSESKRFTAPDLGEDKDFKCSNSNIKFSESWILLWIFKYQSRFRLPDAAINPLFSFLCQVLKDADPNRFKNFPCTSYLAKKILQIVKIAKKYAVCPECNKLYIIKKISAGFKCNFIEFPQHPMKNFWEICETELLKNIPVTGGYTTRSRMIFPMPNLKAQIFAIFTSWNNYQPRLVPAFRICGLLLGPNKIQVNKINHYLSPIVDELLEFCTEGESSNYGGFDDMNDWFRQRDLEEFWQDALAWRKCHTKEERKDHVSTRHVLHAGL